jgi:hypothetical protein
MERTRMSRALTAEWFGIEDGSALARDIFLLPFELIR